ncbi:MAG: hypothetical protein HOC71_00160 [Candidatus Latescibacteria bacterium]|jgi:hypothetical protein|nr:hypothetical protein [Candidatus Latescibacterota bacterium]
MVQPADRGGADFFGAKADDVMLKNNLPEPLALHFPVVFLSRLISFITFLAGCSLDLTGIQSYGIRLIYHEM